MSGLPYKVLSRSGVIMGAHKTADNAWRQCAVLNASKSAIDQMNGPYRFKDETADDHEGE